MHSTIHVQQQTLISCRKQHELYCEIRDSCIIHHNNVHANDKIWTNNVSAKLTAALKY